ncbi:MAG: RelA/SpoT domain-containing protein [Terriglobales bacterium]|jgi:ppGpp synthetase/RelA/SpoT-type nucleotidyltranferase
MDLETYTQSKRPDYAALADMVATILQAAIGGYARPLRLQQIQKRAKEPDKLRKKLENRGILGTGTLEVDIKDLAGCRLIFYTNSDVSQFLQSGIIQDNFEVDWDRTKIHHPVPGQTAPENLFISNNYVLKLKTDRTALPEYARFDGLWCEVQVQTILNHAWSEMEHDIIYKKPELAGFGGKLLEAIKERLEKIMKEHLLPAGYEFQKVQDDYERLMSGKELIDRGALKALAECSDNNARHDLLERFRDYVLPNYDDPQSVYPEIKDQLVSAVAAARLTKPRPIETPFGSYAGVTTERIVEDVCDILNQYRYVDIEATFDAVCAMFPGAQSAGERKHLLGLAEHLTQHNLDVWKQAGPYVQTVLVQKIGTMDRNVWGPIRPVLVEVLSEALKTEIHGVSSSYRAVTLSQSSAIPSDALTRMRTEAIGLLEELYKTASSETETREAENALFEASHTPSGSAYSNELLIGILENSTAIVDFFSEVAPGETYEILQSLEHRLLWIYRRNQGIARVLPGDPGVVKARDALNAAILKFRDIVSTNKGFSVYKTLVGFESVFPPAWDDGEFGYEQETAYREQRIDEFVAEINDANAPEWFAIIQRCAQTESDDLATFPNFGLFLQKLSRAKPGVALGFIDRLDERLTGFLGVMLSGLAQSDRRTDLDRKIADWLEQEKHLVEMAHYVQLASQFDPALLRTILALGIKRKDDAVLVQVMSAFARRYADAPDGLIDSVFMPAIQYFSERRDARWVNLVWFIPKERSPLCALTPAQTDIVLKSLLHLRKIEPHGERALALLAKSQPENVFDFFGARLEYSSTREDDDNYEEIPYHFHGLEKRFAGIADHAVSTVRRWFVPGDPMFQFRGGRLLAGSFPAFSEPLARKLQSLVQSGNREDIEFAVRVMSSYHGEAFLNETCMAAVRALPADDPLLSEIEVILQSTGVVSGEFGFVEAYTTKKQEMNSWLNDPDAHVRAFAERYILYLDRRMAAEQRRGEESIELRKRMYDDPGAGNET